MGNAFTADRDKTLKNPFKWRYICAKINTNQCRYNMKVELDAPCVETTYCVCGGQMIFDGPVKQ
jgi:hypothetical protein